ncbi:MAG: V-type ATP synthase subunit D [Candidatus Micrarchaeota archaeon]
MAKLNVKPTRSELLKLKNRIRLAVRGHDLLEEKRDGLLRKFMDLIRVYKKKEKSVGDSLASASRKLMTTRMVLGERVFDSLFVFRKRRVFVEVEESFVMNVKTPSFKLIEEREGKRTGGGSQRVVGAGATPLDFDLAVKEFAQVLPEIVALAEVEKKISLLAPEAEKTRRRVNALKYVIIPSFQETAKSIELKLAEMERSSFAILMRLKETVLA